MNKIRLESHYKYIEKFDFFDKKIKNYNLNFILLKVPMASFIIDVQILLNFVLEILCVQKCSFIQRKSIQSFFLFLTIRKYKMYLYLDFCINFIYLFNNNLHIINNFLNNFLFYKKMWIQFSFLLKKTKPRLYIYPNPNFFIKKLGLRKFYFIP